MPDLRLEHDMVTELRRLIWQSVGRQGQGDVPVGICLSGGLDSSLLAGAVSVALKDDHPTPWKVSDDEESQLAGFKLSPSPCNLTCFTLGFANFNAARDNESGE